MNHYTRIQDEPGTVSRFIPCEFCGEMSNHWFKALHDDGEEFQTVICRHCEESAEPSERNAA